MSLQLIRSVFRGVAIIRVVPVMGRSCTFPSGGRGGFKHRYHLEIKLTIIVIHTSVLKSYLGEIILCICRLMLISSRIEQECSILVVRFLNGNALNDPELIFEIVCMSNNLMCGMY